MNESARPLKVFLACSGLGVIRRGYETFMRSCFDALRSEPGLDLFLFKGAGNVGEAERPLPHFARDGVAARTIGALVHRGPYVIEQATFTTSLLPHIVREKPDVVFFCDPAIGKMLHRWRRMRGGSFRLLFHNSGPLPPPFPWFDFVQQVTPTAYQLAIANGEPEERQILLPCALPIGAAPVAVSDQERSRRRRALGFPETQQVVLSVGALNRSHKRMDYLIREIAAMPEPRPHLVMLGQEEADTPAVRVMAGMLLGEGGFSMRSVAPDEVAEFYDAADLFVLASLHEGFGFAYAEAMARGLPCIAHDYPVARFVLGEEGIFADLSQSGALALAMREALSQPYSAPAADRRHRSVEARFGWRNLAPQYAAMIRSCGQNLATGAVA